MNVCIHIQNFFVGNMKSILIKFINKCGQSKKFSFYLLSIRTFTNRI